MEHKIEIKSFLDGDRILIDEEHKGVINKKIRYIFDTKEKMISEKLIELGWIPPNGKNE